MNKKAHDQTRNSEQRDLQLLTARDR